MSRIVDQVTQLAEPIASELGLELWGVEFVKEGAQHVLRLFIDRPEGISHAECQAMSERIEGLLDASDLIPQSYLLEVSSPGAERALRHEADMRRFSGKRVLLKTYAPVEGQKEWKGTLVGPEEDGGVRLSLPQGERSFAKDQVSLVRLLID